MTFAERLIARITRREPDFINCPSIGWVHWKLFTAADDIGAVGKGCDQ